MAKLSHILKAFIIIKTPFYLLKLLKELTKNIFITASISMKDVFEPHDNFFLYSFVLCFFFSDIL